jgi:NAD(P)-dependent dehydrogenase (short-subunit alcohol dehydrogenase family)
MLVTGGAKRIGRAIALAAAAEGFDIAIQYRTGEKEAADVVREISAMGRRAVALFCDLSHTETVGHLMRQATEAMGQVDVLVNNASIFRESRLMDFDMAELDSEIRVNAFSPLLLSRAFVEQTERGTIINLLDSRINAYDKIHVAYHLSKRMLYDITRMLALELAPGVRVNGVAPGLILPPPGEDDTYLERHRKENPLARYGSVGEIADTVLFLVKNPFVTGQIVFVDGGRHLLTSVYG